jgi:hypothetical protein
LLRTSARKRDELTARRRSVTWVFEIVFALLLTVALLPVLLLYGLDLTAGRVAPDLGKALCAVAGIIGLWVALVSSDALMHRQPVLRWASVTALAFAAALGIYLVWGFARGIGGMAWAAGITCAAAAAVTLHQLVRLVRL